MSTPVPFCMGVPPGIRFFFSPNSRFFSLPHSHAVKTWAYPDLRGKSWPKNFHDHLRGQTEWQLMAWFIDNALSWAVSQGNPGGMAKGHISCVFKQANSIHSKFPILCDIRVCVSVFITAVQMIRNVFTEQVFYGTSAARCLYRPDTPHSSLAFRRNDYRNVIRNWGETWGMKFDTKYSCKMSQVTYTVTQSIVSAGALLTKGKKCSASVHHMGKR